MKAIKIYLIIVTILLLAAIGAGVYVWSIIQNQNSLINENSGTAADTAATESVEVGGVEVSEPITIEMSDIPESQQKVLQTFGFEGDAITVTPAMIACAEDAVGKARFDEIIGGAAPSPLESLKLLPCFKK